MEGGCVVQKRPKLAFPAECLLVSISSARMRILPLTRDQRAFGFDRRVFQLNYEIRGLDTPGPKLVSRIVRSVVHPLKEAVRTVFVGAKSLAHRVKRSRVDEEAGASEEKSAEELAMNDYQRELENTFGSSERIGRVMQVVRLWTIGL